MQIYAEDKKLSPLLMVVVTENYNILKMLMAYVDIIIASKFNRCRACKSLKLYPLSCLYG